MLSKAEKEAVVVELKKNLEKADGLFLTNIVGISANDSVAFRKKVRSADGHVIVAKNTLFRMAAKGTAYEQFFTKLKGPHAVAFSFSDAPAVAKAVYETSKELPIVEVKGGFFEGKEVGKNEIIALATLPSRDQMLATLLATFNAPVSAFVRLLSAIKDKKEAEVSA